VPGHDAYLTIDAGLQEIVEEALVEAIAQYEAEGGDVVVVKPATGEILAVASRTKTGGRTANAFTSVFEPGSTAKPFAVAALLAQGRASMTDSVWGEDGVYEMVGRTIHDDHPSGWVSLAQVIQRSSNIGMVKFAERLAPAEQYEMLRRFGLGTPTSVDYPSESGGILRRPDHWSPLTSASLAMGYELAVTPLQLAQGYAVVANDGVLMRPTLVRRVTAPDGAVVYRHEPEPVRRVVSASVAAELRSALRSVVAKGGTGETAALTTYDLAGKTGTAYRAGPQGYVPGAYTASFVSMFPADRPQLVMVVKLDSPAAAYAAMTAAPLTRVLLERVLAAPTGALNFGGVANGPTRSTETITVPAGDPPRTVVQWPREPQPGVTVDRVVPDLTGTSLRVAARRLHRAGLRMTVVGWGRVERTEPSAGTPLPPGAVVRVLARDRGATEE
jgi:cell division protein FtsI (penicillin-binding protein 3)